MRLLSRWLAMVFGAAGAFFLSLALVQIGMSLSAVGDPEARRSTCSAMKWFGARMPLCGIETGYPHLTAEATRLLNAVSPFYLWGCVAAGSVVLLWFAHLLWGSHGQARRAAAH